MRVLRESELLGLAARQLNRPLLVIHFEQDSDFKNVVKAAPYLADIQAAALKGDPASVELILDGEGVIVCEDEAEQRRLFRLTVGNDGPTKTNPYKGPGNVYAKTISRTGVCETENT